MIYRNCLTSIAIFMKTWNSKNSTLFTECYAQCQSCNLIQVVVSESILTAKWVVGLMIQMGFPWKLSHTHEIIILIASQQLWHKLMNHMKIFPAFYGLSQSCVYTVGRFNWKYLVSKRIERDVFFYQNWRWNVFSRNIMVFVELCGL